MKVLKRNGVYAPLDESKIEKCIAWACDALDVAPSTIYEPVRKALYDGISTKDIHRLAIGEAASQISVTNGDANYVAARLTLQEIYKQAANSIYYPMLGSYIKHAHSIGLLDDRMIDGRFDLEKLDAEIKPERDHLFGYLGIQTLMDRYFLRENPGGRIIEMPQHFWMRVAMGLSIQEEDPTWWAARFYGILSTLEFVSSTPTLFNSGTRHPQLSSCYGNTVADTISAEPGKHQFASIFGAIEECANLSKYAGGIGTDWNRVRSEGDFIRGTSGVSSGVVPYLKIYNDTAVAVNQGGKRKGSFAPYMEPWHPDFESFLELKKNTGDERKRAHEIYPAGWVPDLFMKRVQERGVWSFFSPKKFPELHELHSDEFEKRYIELEQEGKYVRQMPAVELWRKWLTMLFETGHPWITFKDEINRRNPQSHVGVIHNSNLCVAPETAVLTDKGHISIAELSGQRVNVWNGKEFSEVEVFKTGENQSLVKVILSDGAEINCTPYHKFYVQTGYWKNSIVEKRASELSPGDKMIKFDLPAIDGDEEFPHAYTAGFFCGDGTYGRGKPVLHLYGEKKALVGHFAIKSGSYVEQDSGRLSFTLVDDIPAKFTVPHDYSIQSRLNWLAGLMDADGTVARNGTNESVQIASIEKPFLDEVRLMLQTLGVHSKVTLMREATVTRFADGQPAYECQPLYRLLIGSVDTQKLLNLGLVTHRLKIERRAPNRSASQFVQVVCVTDEGRSDDTYCFTEPKRHMGVFNGVLTGQCTEIALNNSDEETFVCNLGSVNLSRVSPQKDYDRFKYVVSVAMRMLDNVIDINFYPSERAKTSNMRHRPIGLGVMGYMEWLVQQGIDFESEEHIQAADELFEALSYEVILASSLLAADRGAYSSFSGSKWDLDCLPIDTARNQKSKLDWTKIRESIKRYGMRNSNCMAIAPTATISNIAGTTPCTEAAVDLIYSKTNLSGDFLVVDPTLKYGRPELAKTMFEIDPIWIIKSAAARQKWIDQAQSTNIFVKAGVKGKDLANIYITAWKEGLKTTYYLRSQSSEVTVKASQPAAVEVVMCSIDNPECEACQ